MSSFFIRASALALLTCTLAACGGGSSSGSSVPVLPTTPTTPTPPAATDTPPAVVKSCAP